MVWEWEYGDVGSRRVKVKCMTVRIERGMTSTVFVSSLIF